MAVEMQESLSFILEFLHRHSFYKAESALKSELTVRGIGEIGGPLSRANSNVSELTSPLSRANSGLDAVNTLCAGELENGLGLRFGNGLPHSISSGSTPTSMPPTSPPGDIPQGLPPVRVRSFELRNNVALGIPGLEATLEEAREDFAPTKSVVSLSAVPPALLIADPVSGPSRTERAEADVTGPALSPATATTSGSSRQSGEPQGLAKESSGNSRRVSLTKTPLISKPQEPVSLEHARELLMGLAIGGGTLIEEESYQSPEVPDDWDSDEYEDEDDPGYHRQAIDDEEAFLANEIDVPSDDEEGGQGHSTEIEDRERKEDREGVGDDPSFLQDEAYFSGEEYYRFEQKDNHGGRKSSNGSKGKGYTSDDDRDELVLGADDIEYDFPTTSPVREDHDPSEKDNSREQAINLPATSSAAAASGTLHVAISELKQIVLDGELQGVEVDQIDIETASGRESLRTFLKGQGLFVSEGEEAAALIKFVEQRRSCMQAGFAAESSSAAFPGEDGGFGFSFPEPLAEANVVTLGALGSLDAGGAKTVWSVGDLSPDRVTPEDPDDRLSGLEDADDMLAGWRRSGTTSPALSPKDDEEGLAGPSTAAEVRPGPGPGSKQELADDDAANEEDEEEPVQQSEGYNVEDDEDAAVHEQIQRMKAEEEQFETFDLRIIHRRNRTGFEEDKDFPVMINSVIAGRYHVTEYLGSAAFSKAIQAHDLHTGMDVCMKIIKNNKDFFDQSLDEIKLLKYINRHDPADEHHVLRLYDYFYHREHLFIVCELLRANLYEFHKYNRESGGEVYFTMARIQSITKQCLEALAYIHSLGLIHCDLKPENILVKSYSRCEIKVIDLGSSCFQTDHLCSYVQSRSYRAPEVILGLPYGQKIDIWSLGCILAELCSGNVLFQNDSLATLLARVIGILGPIDPAMLAKGRDTHKYFTKSYMLYERNPETDRLEYLIPKKSSLKHRLPSGDSGFHEFVAHLLEINPEKRPTAKEALQHSWLHCPYERDW